MTAPDLADVLIPYESPDKFDKKSDKRICILERMLPRIELANSTREPEILLQIAKECEEATLYYLANKYRERAGVREIKKSDARKEYVKKAIAFIEDKGSVTSKEIRQYLGLTKHEFYSVLTGLRKSGLVAMTSGKSLMTDLRWIPKSSMLF